MSDDRGDRGVAGATTAPTASPTSTPAFLNAEQTVYGDLNSGNYTGAWDTAIGTSSMFGTNMGATTTDPLLGALESSSGLQSFDPTKTWNASSLDAYYAAFNATGAYHGQNTSTVAGSNGYLGKNPYGDWGVASAITSGSDQAANIADEGDTPDVARFVGAKPTQSFLSKYGGEIVSVVGDVAGAFVGDPLAGNQIMAVYDATQGNWGGALTNIASSFVPGAGAALGSATGIGTTAGSAVVGAGLGATEAGLSGGNLLTGALTGAASGAISGAGVKAGVSNAVGGGIVGSVAGSAVTTGLNVGAGMAIGAITGSNTATSSAPQSAATTQNSTATPSAAAAATTGAGTGALGSTLGSSGVSQVGGQGSIGNIGNMSYVPQSTDSSLAGTIAGAVPGLLQGAAGVYGAQNAAQAQTSADANAITTQQNNLGNINNIWSTQQQLGQGADTALGSALGTNGQPANYSNFENMPGYQFAVNQGTQAINRQAAAMGSAYTPNTAAAVGQYVTGTASQDYNTYISQLMGAAGLGTTANQGLQTGSQTSANNISTLQQNQGQAHASGVTSASNAVGGIFGVNGAGTSLIGAAGSAIGGALNSNSTGVNSSNPNNLGGSTPVAANGGTLQYDANGNIIGGSVPANSSPDPSSYTSTSDNSGIVSNLTDPNSTSWLTGDGP